MKNEAVTLMRNIRDQMSKEIEGMSWKDEQKYLRKQINVFEFLVNKSSNQSFRRTADAAAEFKRYVGY